MNLSETKSLLALIAAAYPEQFHFHEAMPMLWQECLEDIEADAAARALKDHIKNSEWPPKISEIREIIRQTWLSEIRKKQHDERRIALPSPPPKPVSEEQKAKNKAMVQNLVERIAMQRALRAEKKLA